jgi:hypothetical protein
LIHSFIHSLTLLKPHSQMIEFWYICSFSVWLYHSENMTVY